jgi:hypothetical protein
VEEDLRQRPARPRGVRCTPSQHRAAEFDTLGEAETFAGRLQEVWKGSASRTVSDAGHRITEVLEQQQFGRESSRRAA